ncbi:MAG: hypothetical protein KR126chlam2_00413 [Chlamydiae bacterium]|nr:hypothetical protein [Chlamydiota bacterium]
MSATAILENVALQAFPEGLDGESLSFSETFAQEGELAAFTTMGEPTAQKVMDLIKETDFSTLFKDAKESPISQSKTSTKSLERSFVSLRSVKTAEGKSHASVAKKVENFRPKIEPFKTAEKQGHLQMVRENSTNRFGAKQTPRPFNLQKGGEGPQTRNHHSSKSETVVQSIHTPREMTKSVEERKFQEKEREKGSSDQQQQQEHEQREQKKKRVIDKIQASCAVGAEESDSSFKQKKLTLPPPGADSFSLMFELEKLELLGESLSFAESKGEIEALDIETTAAHKQMMKEMEEAIKNQKSTKTWGVMASVFSWLGSIATLITGIALIATGVGVIAGSLLIAGSVITISNQIMQMTGGWEKVKKLLPGNNEEEKQAVITWIQIAITILCLILAGAGIVFGGFSQFGEAISSAMQLIGGGAAAAGGITALGMGIHDFLHRDHLGEAKIHESRLASLKHRREDLMETVDDAPERLEHIFDFLARVLGFRDEINASHQAAW